MYDLAVAYRIYPKVSKPSLGLPFDDDKYRQAEIGLRSFKRSLGSLRVKVWAVLDGCPPAYDDLFRRYFVPEDLVLVPMERVGNFGTFAKQVDILLGQTDAEAVYFAEDDYLYLPEKFPVFLRFLREGRQVDFATPFDHPDCYSLALHDFPKRMQVFEGMHWRNAASTCLTFLTTKSALAEYEDVFRSYSKGNYDSSLWLSLTKYRILNPFSFIRFLSADRVMRGVMVKAWLYGWRQNVFGRKATLWAPMPSIALHLDLAHPAPGFDLGAEMLLENELGMRERNLQATRYGRSLRSDTR
jgi:hypothetical protein